MNIVVVEYIFIYFVGGIICYGIFQAIKAGIDECKRMRTKYHSRTGISKTDIERLGLVLVQSVKWMAAQREKRRLMGIPEVYE